MFATRLLSRRPHLLFRAKVHGKSRLIHNERPLPDPRPRRGLYILGGVAGISLWAVGLATAMNYQRLSTSVVTGTLFTVRHDPTAKQALGNNIGYASRWPWISGTVNHFKGRVDVQFDVKGEKAKGRVRFATHRKGADWYLEDFTLKLEDGSIYHLDSGVCLTNTGELDISESK
ncbi:uncharacterized protein VTP21DRAFT_11589 [Calcarisporiella thermophila]|uniref:uncharacterized protein n=1 Tax=Calcarisporiella thermophila TaxID=911321 RepID=UPI003742ED43